MTSTSWFSIINVEEKTKFKKIKTIGAFVF